MAAKRIAIVIGLFLLAAMVCPQKTGDGWTNIYYVLDANGKQVAKRIHQDSATWYIDKPEIALERMYLEKVKAEKNYQLALGILKQLNPNGTPKDQKAYNEAVLAFNNR